MVVDCVFLIFVIFMVCSIFMLIGDIINEKGNFVNGIENLFKILSCVDVDLLVIYKM